jgi:mycothiol synthase
MQEATRTVAARCGVWPLDQRATDWLFANDSSGTSAVGEPEVLVVRAGVGRSLFALRFGDSVEVIAPDTDTAADTLPTLFPALPRTSLVWARGLRSPVAAAALALGLAPARRIMVLVRELDQPIGAPRLPEGFTVRAFRPGADDAAWLALNRAAFATLPDQGAWTAEDLRAKLSAAWFDPTAFLVLQAPDGSLAGCVWVKFSGHSELLGTQADARPRSHPGTGGSHSSGEIFILSVHPRHHGVGLGRALLIAGLARIHAAGCDRAHLYVDSENESAGSLYRAAGFIPRERVLAFANPAHSNPAFASHAFANPHEANPGARAAVAGPPGGAAH